MKLVAEYAKTMEAPILPHPTFKCVSRWQFPPAGMYKLNSDAVNFGSKIGVGEIIRDHEGGVIASICNVREGKAEVDVAEACAARKGLRIALEAGITSIILETDYLKLFFALRKGKCNNPYFGSIVNEILLLSR